MHIPSLIEKKRDGGELTADEIAAVISGFTTGAVQRSGDRHWKFTRWDLVDLSHFQVKLKAEFQGSNNDRYRPEAIVATSGQKLE
jgi:Glycosyl transferase family, helical bundle domain